MTNMDIDNVGASTPAFSLAILETIKRAQLSNGLRHGDYQRYRQYCSRRLRRIRQQLNFKFGKGKVFVSREISSKTPALSESHFSLLLMNAERAWSYAMQIRQEEQHERDELGEDEVNSRLKFHLIARLSKAAKWSHDLLALCQSTNASDRMVLEAQAYVGLIQGQLELYREHWIKARDHFKTAEHVVSQLTTVLMNLQDQDLFTSILDKDIRPYLRYCEYNVSTLSGNSDSVSQDTAAFSNDSSLLMLENKLQTVLKNLATQKAESMNDTDHFGIQWKGEYLMIRNKELRATFLRVQDLIVQYTEMNHQSSALSSDSSKSKDSQTQREQCFLDIFRTFDVMFKLLVVQESKLSVLKSGLQVDTQRYELTCLREYLTYQKSKQMVSRNIAVFQDLSHRSETKDAERIHLLDMILQNIKDMDTSEEMSEHQECASRRAIFGVLRCYYLARTLSEQHHFSQALVVIDHGQTLYAQAQADLNASYLDSIADMEPQLCALQSQVVASSCLETLGLASDFSSVLELDKNRRSQNHLERFHIPSSIVHLPPKIEAVASKPVLFDVAFNEVSQMPDLLNHLRMPEEQTQGTPDREEPVAGSGFFNWFRS